MDNNELKKSKSIVKIIEKIITKIETLSYFQIGLISVFIILFFAIIYNPIEFSPEPEKNVVSNIIEDGYIKCFSEKMKYNDGEPVFAEPSGVAYYDDKIYLINDKPIPGLTPFMCTKFHIPFNRRKIEYLGNDYVRNARKFEDMTITPHQKYMFLITGFNKFKKNKGKKDAYNTLIYKRLQPEGAEKLAYPSMRDGVYGSIKLRQKISSALRSIIFPHGPGYFKVEGLAAIPGNTLLIGIRAIGNSSSEKEFCVKIVGAKYKIEKGEFKFVEELRELYSFNPKKNKFIDLDLGLSSIEYDIFNNRLYILTSYEFGDEDQNMGGYLWFVDLDDFYKRKFPTLLMEKIYLERLNKNSVRPLLFAHKPEGITILNNQDVFIIHDDDKAIGHSIITNPRIEFSRKINEAAYTIVRIWEEEKNNK